MVRLSTLVGWSLVGGGILKAGATPTSSSYHPRHFETGKYSWSDPSAEWYHHPPFRQSHPTHSLPSFPLQMRNPHRTPPSFSKREDMKLIKKCDGKKNLIDDFGIISFIISVFSTFVGFGLDLVLSFKGNMIAIASKFLSFLFGIPAALITALNISNPFLYFFANAMSVLSFATTFFSASSLDVGNLGLATDLFFEVLGIVGLVLSVFSTFPDLFDEVINFAGAWGYGRPVRRFIEGYGCPNHYEWFGDI